MRVASNHKKSATGKRRPSASAAGSAAVFSLIGVALCLAALVTLLWQTALTAPGRIWILVVMITMAFAIEFVFRLATGRSLNVFK